MPNRFHVIKDPVHGSMQFTTEENNWVKPFIDTELFQRLRHIRQLGLADWIFPGALHNRFSHSLGCCYIASQISHQLPLPVKDRQQVMLACLLHDIGHGPFSHVFEVIFWNDSIKHEDWTPLFLEEYASMAFLDVFNARNPESPLLPEEILRLKMNRKSEKSVLCDIVSSQLDADRLDYLLRDTYFCGVTYGHYDFRWLLHCLEVVNFNQQERLGITSKGIGAIEQYLMARRLMIRNVYQHSKKYGIEFLLQEFLKQVAIGLMEDRYFKPFETDTLVQFLKAVNFYNEQAKTAPDLGKFKQTFIQDTFPLYKKLCDYDVFSLIRALSLEKNIHHPAVTIAERLQSRKPPKILRLNKEQAIVAKRLIEETMHKARGKIEPWQAELLDLQNLSYQGVQDPILVQDSSGTVRLLQENSLVVNALSDKSEDACVFCMDVGFFASALGNDLYTQLQQL